MISKNGKSVDLKREFKVPIESLYKAWTDPQIFKKWWKGVTIAEFDFRVGGTYLIKWASDPEDYARGIYREINPHQKIVMTWNTSDSCGGEKASVVKDSVITLIFTAVSKSLSHLQLIHDLLPIDRVDDHHEGWTSAMLDMDKYFNSDSRKVDSDLKAVVSRTLNFSVSKVFEAWTNPQLMNRWFNSAGHTLGRASSNLKVGGKFFMDYQKKSGDLLRIYGEYKEIKPLEKLVFTWIEDNHIDEFSFHRQYESLVTVSFRDLGTKTEIEVIHSQLSSADLMKDFEEGWTDCLRSIEEELTNN